MSESKASKGFYILSVKWSEGRECATWWGPNLSGYSMFLEKAGLYSAEEVAQHDLNRGDGAMAIPAETVEALAFRSVHSNGWDALMAARLPRDGGP